MDISSDNIKPDAAISLSFENIRHNSRRFELTGEYVSFGQLLRMV
jgi:hypothetical protein